jgi:hypothetical protein
MQVPSGRKPVVDPFNPGNKAPKIKPVVDPRPPKNVKTIKIPKTKPKATKKPVKNNAPVFMPIVNPKPRNGGGIFGPTGRNVNSVYNTY